MNELLSTLTRRATRVMGVLGASVVLGPLVTLGAHAMPSAGLGEPALARSLATRPKVGTYEGFFGPKGARTPVSIDVVKRHGSFRVSQALVVYYCGEVDGDPGYGIFDRMKVRRGRFSESTIVSIRGSFESRTKITGTSQPALAFFGCKNPKPHPFTARYVGPTLDRSGSYAGVDAAGVPVTFEVTVGRMLDELEVNRELICGNLEWGSLFRFGLAAVRHSGEVTNTVVEDGPTTFTYTAAFDSAGTVSGTYRVNGPGCDTGPVGFTASRTG